jgi:hypothetical protein
MNSRYRLLTAIATFLSVILLSSAASAFCGTVQASAAGATREEAISVANSKGLRETRRLDSNYGGAVQYNPANVNCQPRYAGVSCSITQKFCVNGAGSRQVRGEEGDRAHGCPPGTRSVPETDNCVPIGRTAKQPWKTPGCGGWQRACDRGDARACAKYETTCQVN